MSFFKEKRIVNRTLLDEVRQQKCIASLSHVNQCYGLPVGHHLKTVKSGGDDVESNLVPLCMKHHSEIHTIGMIKFAEQYYSFLRWLEKQDRWDLLDKIDNLSLEFK